MMEEKRSIIIQCNDEKTFKQILDFSKQALEKGVYAIDFSPEVNDWWKKDVDDWWGRVDE